MPLIPKQIPILLAALLILVCDALAAEPAWRKDCDDPNPPKLQSHEPNTVGLTFDSNDVPYLDIKLSLKYPMFHNGLYCGGDTNFLNLYAAGTVRVAQYSSNDRHSSPVIGKRFNPMLFVRHWLESEDNEERHAYIDLGYAHESNGQSIDDPTAYDALRASNPDHPEFANDFVSRGWDYFNLVVKEYVERGGVITSGYLDLKYFPTRSPPQGKTEELNSWEGRDNGKPRRSVDGITGILKFSSKTLTACRDYLRSCKLAAIYTTGYKDPFKYSTVRLEFTGRAWALPPVMVWWSDGYNSDLVDYFKRVRSHGFSVELRTFE
ncbi:MAG: phospholipase A [Nitrospirae bacterium]|nr:phospholipase A [Nitrospirota bacterium]